MVANSGKPVPLFDRLELREEWLEAHPEHPGVRLKMRKKRSAAPGIEQVERAQADGRWDAAYCQKGMVVPADLQTALDGSPEAAATFSSLNAQARFGIVFRLDRVVRAETRERKLAAHIEQLARGESPI